MCPVYRGTCPLRLASNCWCCCYYSGSSTAALWWQLLAVTAQERFPVASELERPLRVQLNDAFGFGVSGQESGIVVRVKRAQESITPDTFKSFKTEWDRLPHLDRITWLFTLLVQGETCGCRCRCPWLHIRDCHFFVQTAAWLRLLPRAGARQLSLAEPDAANVLVRAQPPMEGTGGPLGQSDRRFPWHPVRPSCVVPVLCSCQRNVRVSGAGAGVLLPRPVPDRGGGQRHSVSSVGGRHHGAV